MAEILAFKVFAVNSFSAFRSSSLWWPILQGLLSVGVRGFFWGKTNLIKGFEVLVVYFDLGKNEKKYEGGRKNTRS